MPLDLVDRIERGRYLGREFLVWLWFESNVQQGGDLEKQPLLVTEIMQRAGLVEQLPRQPGGQ